MRIKQLFCRFGGHFAQAMSEKYKLEIHPTSINPKEPLFMFGCYDFRHLHIAINHSRFHHQLAVICWGGSDAANLRNAQIPGNDFWPQLLREAQVKHIAISPWIADDLDALGLEYYSLPVTPYSYGAIKPEPAGEAIYMYQPQNSNYNGNGLYQEVKKKLPDYEFLEASFGDMEWDEMMQVYKECFIGLRFTNHDGCSNTVCEMGMMGRRVIHNGAQPNSIHYKGMDSGDIVELIRNEYLLSRLQNWQDDIAKDVWDYLNIGEDFLDTDYYVQVPA